MGYGFFGKVPQRGDYLAVNLPPAVLGPLETWLAAAMAESQRSLGPAWRDHYLVSPIWRFWMPPTALGVACSGAVMPSVDSGGRYFPAVLAFVCAPGRRIAAPGEWDSAAWYEALDARLLGVLAAEDDGYLGGLLSGLEPPALWDGPCERTLWWRGEPGESGFSSDGLPPPSAYAGMIAP